MSLKHGMNAATIRPILPILVGIILSWPPSKRFPVLDLIRLAAIKAHGDVTQYTNIVDKLTESAELSGGATSGGKELDNNSFLVLRILVNFFEEEPGRRVAMEEYVKVHSLEKYLNHRRSWMPRRLG
jgi:PUL domain